MSDQCDSVHSFLGYMKDWGGCSMQVHNRNYWLYSTGNLNVANLPLPISVQYSLTPHINYPNCSVLHPHSSSSTWLDILFSLNFFFIIPSFSLKMSSPWASDNRRFEFDLSRVVATYLLSSQFLKEKKMWLNLPLCFCFSFSFFFY